MGCCRDRAHRPARMCDVSGLHTSRAKNGPADLHGRRFVITTLPHEQTQYDLLKDVSRSVGARPVSRESAELMKVKWASLQSVTPQELNLDLCPIQLGAAVAGSMSFPPVVGPITFKVE